jgi:hypothetical protein
LQALQTASQFAYSGLQKRLLPPNVKRKLRKMMYKGYKEIKCNNFFCPTVVCFSAPSLAQELCSKNGKKKKISKRMRLRRNRNYMDINAMRLRRSRQGFSGFLLPFLYIRRNFPSFIYTPLEYILPIKAGKFS